MALNAQSVVATVLAASFALPDALTRAPYGRVMCMPSACSSMPLSASSPTSNTKAPATMNNMMQSAQPDLKPNSMPDIAIGNAVSIDVRQKVSADESYIVSLAFVGLPGTISNFSVSADYVVDNVQCVPTQPISGAVLRPEHSLKLDLRQTDTHRFATTLHTDALLDEDYFGLGLCRWVLNWVTVRFESPSTRFVGAIAIDQIYTGHPAVLHYLANDYRESPETNSSVFGEEMDLFTDEAGPRFTLTVTASEAPK